MFSTDFLRHIRSFSPLKRRLILKDFFKQAFFLSLDFDFILCAWGAEERREELNTFPKEMKGPFFFLSDFFLEEKKPWWCFEKAALFPKAYFLALLEEFQDGSQSEFRDELRGRKDLRIWLKASKEKFFSQAERMEHFFQEEKLKKVVLMTAETSEGFPSYLEKCSLLLSSLRHQKRGTSIYGFWVESQGGEGNKEGGVRGMIGVTPETLFDWNRERQSLFSMALAGTLTQTSKASLLHQKKDLEEHKIVVQDLTQKLDAMSVVGKLWTSQTYEWKIGFLKHLRTDFFVKTLSSLSEKSLIERLHPTSALGLASKCFHWKWLKSLEREGGFERQYFGAPFGVFLPDCSRFFCLVAIRNIQWFDGKMYLISGCGYISESEKEKEWKELEWKREAVKNLFYE